MLMCVNIRFIQQYIKPLAIEDPSYTFLIALVLNRYG